MVRRAGRNSIALSLAKAAKQKANELCRAERGTERVSGSRNCEVMADWIGTDLLPPVADNPRNRAPGRAVLQLIADDRFSGAFGKKYGHHTSQELSGLRKSLNSCLADQTFRKIGTNERRAADLALDPLGLSPYSAALENRRNTTDEVSALVAELERLQPTETDYDRMRAIHIEADSLLSQLPSDYRITFNRAYTPVETRLAPSIEETRVRQALQTASGMAGVLKLDKLRRSLNTVSFDRDLARERETQRAQLWERIVTLIQPMATFELGQVNALGTGLAGLERGLIWERKFDEQYAMVKALEDIVSVKAHYRLVREKALQAAKPAFEEATRRASSAGSIDSLVGRTLGSADQETTTGRSYLGAAAWRKYQLYRRDVLAVAPANARSMLDRRQPAGRPPNAEEMFDAISAVMIASAGAMQDIAADCQSGPNKDPVRTVACLYTMLMPATQTPMRITRFERMSCVPAQNQPGYICDYMLGIAGGVVSGMGAFSEGISAAGSRVTARFLYTDSDEWVFLSSTG